MDIKNVWNQLTFWTFVGGFNYQDDKRHYIFPYVALGYIIMIMLLVIERKSEVWISSKFGCQGKTLQYL